MGKWIAGALAAISTVVIIVIWATGGREIPRPAMEKEFAKPPSRFLVLTDGTRIHYRDRGPRDAPAVILLHGFAGSLFVWERWSQNLSDRFRVVSLDLPGNGLTGAVPSGDYSQAAIAGTVVQVANRLGLDKFALAGNSMGGGVAARIAELHPARVTALILIDSAGARIDTGRRLHLIYYGAHVPVLSRYMLSKIVDRHYPFAHMEGMSEAMIAHFRLPDDSFVWDHVAAIKTPTLVMWGARDNLIPLAAGKAWHRAIVGSRLVVYPDAGHVSMADAPAASTADARAFLTERLAPPR